MALCCQTSGAQTAADGLSVFIWIILQLSSSVFHCTIRKTAQFSRNVLPHPLFSMLTCICVRKGYRLHSAQNHFSLSFLGHPSIHKKRKHSCGQGARLFVESTQLPESELWAGKSPETKGQENSIIQSLSVASLALLTLSISHSPSISFNPHPFFLFSDSTLTKTPSAAAAAAADRAFEYLRLDGTMPRTSLFSSEDNASIRSLKASADCTKMLHPEALRHLAAEQTLPRPLAWNYVNNTVQDVNISQSLQQMSQSASIQRARAPNNPAQHRTWWAHWAIPHASQHDHKTGCDSRWLTVKLSPHWIKELFRDVICIRFPSRILMLQFTTG